MAFVTTIFTSETALATFISPGTVETFTSEDALDTALNALTSETITKLMVKGMFYTLVLDADFGANTLISMETKGMFYTVTEETP